MDIAPLWVIENQWYDLSYLESRGISVGSLRQLTEEQTPIALLRRQNGSTKVQFRFVGIIANNSSVLYCVPKYTDKLPETPDTELIDSFKATLSATLRATHKRLESIGSQDYYRNDTSQTDHWLTTARTLIYDFIRSGSYYSRVTTIGNDPYDEACWDETIASSLAMYKAGRPFYPEPFTHNQQLTCNSVIARLHHSILQDALDRLRGYDPLNALNIPRPIIPASISITSLGSVSSLLNIIESESRRQFQDRKLKVLRLMSNYLRELPSPSRPERYLTIGTTSFHVVWEAICSWYFRDELKEGKYRISSPIWNYRVLQPNGTYAEVSHFGNGTLVPDIAFRHQDRIYLIDAKYYIPRFEDEGIWNQPGATDIAKQYVYVSAIETLWPACHLHFNAFVFPLRHECNQDNHCSVRIRGRVCLPFDRLQSLPQIRIVEACPLTLINHYNQRTRDSKSTLCAFLS